MSLKGSSKIKKVGSDLLALDGQIDEGIVFLKSVLLNYDVIKDVVSNDEIFSSEDETEVKEVYDASRKYEIYDHEKDDGISGFITVIGGKYTTSRNLAQKLTDMAAEKLEKTFRPCATHRTPLPGGGWRKTLHS